MKPHCWHGLCILVIAEFKQFEKTYEKFIIIKVEKAKPAVKRGRKATDLRQEDSRVASTTLGGYVMKKFLITLFVVTVAASLSSMAFADSSWTIEDTYIGADPTSSSYDGKDVIGDNHLFGVDRMEIDLTGNLLTIDIYSWYFDNVGKYYTSLGDLFISTDGWDPEGDAPYLGDNSTTGETWEYVFDLETAALYNIEDAQDHIVMSTARSGYIYRAGQEVSVDTSGLNSVADGSVDTYLNVDGRGLNYKSISFDISALNMKPEYLIGLHWTMSCGNDVIEGAFDPGIVPEPSTVILLGLGLLGVFGIGRKRIKK